MKDAWVGMEWRHRLKKKRAGYRLVRQVRAFGAGPMFAFRSLLKFTTGGIRYRVTFRIEEGRISIMNSVVVRQGVGIFAHHGLN